MNNLRNILVLLIVCAGVLVFYSCEKENVKPVVYNEHIALNFNVFNDDGILNFETIADYEAAIDYLVTLESENNLDLFDETLGFISYRSKYKNNIEKMDDIQDDILATFLNPDLKVVIENNIFEVDMPNESVTVLAYNECELKSTSDDLFIGIFSCEDDILTILEGRPNLKSSSFCERRDIKMSQKVTFNSYTTQKFIISVDYIKAGIYYTLNARIKQEGETKKGIGLRTTHEKCYYTKRNNDSFTYAKDESGENWERNFRPYWGGQRLREYKFEVDFYYLRDNGTEGHIHTIDNVCKK